MTARNALISLTTATVVTIVIVATSLLTAAAATALAGFSWDLPTTVSVTWPGLPIKPVTAATAGA